jgi:hypothetical protein
LPLVITVMTEKEGRPTVLVLGVDVGAQPQQSGDDVEILGPISARKHAHMT